jgi:hypothetical protein
MKHEDTVTFVGELNVWKAYETLGKLLGKQYGIDVKMTELKEKGDGAKVYTSREEYERDRCTPG